MAHKLNDKILRKAKKAPSGRQVMRLLRKMRVESGSGKCTEEMLWVRKAKHFLVTCPDKKKNGGNACGRAFNINVRDAEEDPELVNGTFSVNNLLVHVLFYSGADLSFVFNELSPKIITPLSPLDRKYTVKVTNGNILKGEKVYRNCRITLADRSFEVDLIPIKLGSFDIIIGMDWLSKNRAEIVCYDKAIRIPQGEEEPLMIFGDKKCKQLNLISCLKVRKYLRKACHAILAHVSKPYPKEKDLSDVAIFRDFTKVFPEDLPELPLHRVVEFQIDLTPGAAPVAHTPYRLAPSKLQELASQLQELLEKGFIHPSSSPWELLFYLLNRRMARSDCVLITER
ncbi:uncharacterized protein [Rutidosis leptorrhynchoides]|uniref:uncharacterized protein n=1 Tax=Rutidosis leptorrhynchoides TaxID=125765 RepID=UPI003A9A2C10